jgi:succinate-acetate transporter protein
MTESIPDIESRLSALEERLDDHTGRAHAASPPAIANPAPLGLFAFGITTLLLNLVNTELVEGEMISLVLGYGMFYGGIAQFAAAMWEFKKNNTFGATAFASFGAFWMGLALWHILADAGIENPSSSFTGGFAAYLGVWGLFTGLMFVVSLKLDQAIQSVFLTLTVLFFLLAIGQYNETVHVFAGYEGIVTAFTAIYAAWATLLNEVWGRTVLPMNFYGPRAKTA